jgi:hypothetical protein
MGIEAIAALAGLILPPAFDFIKKRFIKTENDTPERTMGTLATSKPEALGPYVEGMAKMWESRTQWFNRDVSGQPSQWVVDTRASIRPLSVVAGLSIIAVDMVWALGLDENTKAAIWANNSSWFGSRL